MLWQMMRFNGTTKTFGMLLCVVSGLLRADLVDFDQSMGKGLPEYDACLQSIGMFPIAVRPNSSVDLLDYFRELYVQNGPALEHPSAELKIPKVIHMIWLGKPFPSQFKKFRESWIAHHPDWTHIFWVDNPENYREGELIPVSDMAQFQQELVDQVYAGHTLVVDIRSFRLENQNLYDEHSNYGTKSDIAKYELVYYFGGLYVDTDFQCLRPFDTLHHCYDFYTGIQPLEVSALVLGAALFAASPRHSILNEVIHSFGNSYSSNRPKWLNISMATGPIHFTKAFWHAAPRAAGATIAFPVSYFYPVSFSKMNLFKKDSSLCIVPESMAVHHWAGSWI